MGKTKSTQFIVLLALFLVGAGTTGAQTRTTTFNDDFNSGASPFWANESGHWVATNGVYKATAPSNFPFAVSSLPFNLRDFTLEADINNLYDGGIFLRCTPRPGTVLGMQGVLLVLNPNIPGVKNMYFHIVTNDTTAGPYLNQVNAPFANGANVHLRIEVSGNTYSAFLNGSATPTDTLTTPLFESGRVALYDNSGQNFDNVSLLAECRPRGAAATSAVVNGFVVGATVTDGGCGYTNTPLVLILGGGGNGATAAAVLTNGVVTGITITSAGIGYTSTPTVYIYSPLGLQIGLVKAIKPSFSDLLLGTNYYLQVSPDMSTWTNVGVPFTATSPTMVYPQYWDVDNWNRLFFRLRAVP